MKEIILMAPVVAFLICGLINAIDPSGIQLDHSKTSVNFGYTAVANLGQADESGDYEKINNSLIEAIDILKKRIEPLEARYYQMRKNLPDLTNILLQKIRDLSSESRSLQIKLWDLERIEQERVHRDAKTEAGD